MPIRIATALDSDGWAALRARLWPAVPASQHRAEIALLLKHAPQDCISFVDAGRGPQIRGFAEAALRRDYVNGCETSPVGYLEGTYVQAGHRDAGVGRTLVQAVQEWARERGCQELASDADLSNLGSQAFHKAAGFEETERVVYFRQIL